LQSEPLAITMARSRDPIFLPSVRRRTYQFQANYTYSKTLDSADEAPRFPAIHPHSQSKVARAIADQIRINLNPQQQAVLKTLRVVK
jgi:hypothetical protein